MDLFSRKNSPRAAAEEHWIPLSDLMTGLMMLFMLVAIVFMIQVDADTRKVKTLAERTEAQAKRMKDIAIVYDDMRGALYNDLRIEFQNDLPKWVAELDPDLVIRFKAPEVLFETKKSVMQQRFKDILDDFFPRYLRILAGAKYKNSIEEIRIEGHSSSIWNDKVTPDQAYLLNMELSQARARSVLEHVLAQQRPSEQRQWLISLLTANGLSSSKPRMNIDGSENRDASQRVEFRVRTNADSRIAELLRAAQQ